MATLSDTAYVSRQAIQYMIATLLALIMGRMLLGGLVTLWQRLNPAPPPPPTMGYGILPRINFPDKPANLRYTLQTASGSLPNFPDRINVYQVISNRPNLLALDEARAKAAAMGFSGPAEKRSDLLYLWERTEPVSGKLNMYIYQGNFVMSMDWFEDPAYLFEQKLPSEDNAIRNVKIFLDRAGLMPSDLKSGPAEVDYLRARGTSLIPAVSLSEADFLEINFFRSPIDENYKSMTANPDQGLVRAVLGGGNVATGLVNLEYNYFPINYDQAETYPLKPASVAWEELLAGGGYVARVKIDVTDVIVRRVELGYYDSYSPQEYLQPVYIFSGDDSFVGYVPALSDQSYGVNTSTKSN